MFCFFVVVFFVCKRIYAKCKGHAFLGSKKGKKKIQGVPQSQAAAHSRYEEKEETDKTKQAQIKKRTKSTKVSSLFPKRGK